MELLEKIQSIVEEARQALASAKSESDVEAVRAKTIGRNGAFTALGPLMGKIPPEQKREAGKAFNDGKQTLLAMIESAREALAGAGSADANKLDVTLPGRKWHAGRKHPVSQTFDECCAIFRRMGFLATGGPEIETVFNNFDALNAPPDHPSRSPQDTFFFEDGRLMRSHTSPVQIRTMLLQSPPIKMICPGATFRRDYDLTHTPMFHQIEGLVVDEVGAVNFAHLKYILESFLHYMFGAVKVRFRSSFFPFTEPSAEVDISCIFCHGDGCRVCSHTGWLEVLGCGMVHHNVFEAVGYKDVSGYAFGMGIERLCMLSFGIGDLRSFFETDLRLLEQF